MKRMTFGMFVAMTCATTALADDATNSAPAMTPQPHVGVSAAPPNAPGEGFKPDRYETLWTKSPFSVATPDAVEESPDYSLVGVAKQDDIFYATLVQKQNQQHFVLTSDKPTNGLTLSSVTMGQNGTQTTATLMQNGQPLLLRLEQAAMSAPVAMPVPQGITQSGIAIPQGGSIQNIQMPGANLNPGGGPNRPLIRIHRSAIHVPPRAEQPPPAPAPAGQ